MTAPFSLYTVMIAGGCSHAEAYQTTKQHKAEHPLASRCLFSQQESSPLIPDPSPQSAQMTCIYLAPINMMLLSLPVHCSICARMRSCQRLHHRAVEDAHEDGLQGDAHLARLACA